MVLRMCFPKKCIGVLHVVFSFCVNVIKIYLMNCSLEMVTKLGLNQYDCYELLKVS